MLDHHGFDLWADGYDASVGVSDEENSYPFAGYKMILGSIYKTIMEKPNPAVLDIGFGTGTLTVKLYENGCEVYGQDFSSRMIELASAKMPDAHLYKGDFSQGLAEPLKRQSYDFIVATYSIHHLRDDQKIVSQFCIQPIMTRRPSGIRIVAVMVCSPSLMKISALKRSRISRSLISPLRFGTRQRR